MATVTPGYTFTNDEVVTPAKLNSAATPAVVLSTGEVTESKIATDAVTNTKIATDAVTNAKIANDAVTNTKIANGAVTQEKLNASVTLVPTGAVMAFAMNSAPSGWLAANGNEYSKTGTYAALFAVIGSIYGETNGTGGTGTTHFRVPDLRGYFVRGSGTNLDATVSGTFGAKQTDAFQGHRHSLLANTLLINSASANWTQGGFPNVSNTTTGIGDPSTDGTNGTPRTANETRPRNIAMLYCIKA
jgi:microcystin-dependent protein